MHTDLRRHAPAAAHNDEKRTRILPALLGHSVTRRLYLLTVAILSCVAADLVTPTIPGAFALGRPSFFVAGLISRDGNDTGVDSGDVAPVQPRTDARPLQAPAAEHGACRAPAEALSSRPDLAILRLTPFARSLLADDN